MSSIVDKLREEIKEGKKMRHEFALRKFAFLTLFLGGGSLANKVSSTFAVDLAWLLFLVPIVAIAFDFYILTEDYRIKRAGEFLRSNAFEADPNERKWEEFCHAHPNYLSTAAFAIVTLIYLLGASLVLVQHLDEAMKRYYVLWIVCVVLIETLLVLGSVFLRILLKSNKKLQACNRNL